jgi:hypothetical protein
LGRERPGVLTVIVTNEPGRFGRLGRRRPGSLDPLVVPKPPWAWTLLDIIRVRTDRHGLTNDAR